MTTSPITKETPILFKAEMVRAILDGHKTQTRRICKTQTQGETDIIAYALMEDMQGADDGLHEKAAWEGIRCPFGKPGDRIWVRETHLVIPAEEDEPAIVHYRADMSDNEIADEKSLLRKFGPADYPWTPSIHMPRWACRIVLEIESVRVERLNDINETDAITEGVPVRAEGASYPPVDCFMCLWESINGLGSWEANPFVWVINFKRITP